MDSQTEDFYDRYAQRLTISSEASRSAMLPHIERAVPPGGSVLDVGAGSGRDVAALLEAGFDAYGVEPNARMLQTALHLHAPLAGRLVQAALPGIGRPFVDRMPAGFDAVVCSAVLMHLETDEMLRSLDVMVAQLRASSDIAGRAGSPALLISLPHMEASRLNDRRDEDRRRFYNHDPGRVRDHLAKLGLALAHSEESRVVFIETGTIWNTSIFRRNR